jgi:hypothetical protein
MNSTHGIHVGSFFAVYNIAIGFLPLPFSENPQVKHVRKPL